MYKYFSTAPFRKLTRIQYTVNISLTRAVLRSKLNAGSLKIHIGYVHPSLEKKIKTEFLLKQTTMCTIRTPLDEQDKNSQT